MDTFVVNDGDPFNEQEESTITLYAETEDGLVLSIVGTFTPAWGTLTQDDSGIKR